MFRPQFPAVPPFPEVRSFPEEPLPEEPPEEPLPLPEELSSEEPALSDVLPVDDDGVVSLLAAALLDVVVAEPAAGVPVRVPSVTGAPLPSVTGTPLPVVVTAPVETGSVVPLEGDVAEPVPAARDAASGRQSVTAYPAATA
jgi:hypothetical protein